MGRSAALGLLGLMAVSGGADAQPLPSTGTVAAAREQLAAGNLAEAAGLFHRALLEKGRGRFTLRVGMFCDLSNLERSLRASGNPPEVLVLRRPVGDRPCLAVYWGLFPSPAAASAARRSVPAALRAAGQSPVAVSSILPAGEPPARLAAAPAPAPEDMPPAPPPDAVARPASEPVPEPKATEPKESPVEPPPAPVPPAIQPPPVPSSPSAASVRVPVVEFEVGYSALWDDTLSGGGEKTSFELGGILSGCANLTRELGVVGEASAHYDSDQILDALGVPVSRDLDLLGVHAGLRYTHRAAGLAEPYLQALAGWTRTGIKVAGQREVGDDFSFQPGAGLRLRLSRSVGIALGADYRLVFAGPPHRNELRLHAGLVLAIGDR